MYYRHKNDVPAGKLIDLCDEQIEMEKWLKEIDYEVFTKCRRCFFRK